MALEGGIGALPWHRAWPRLPMPFRPLPKLATTLPRFQPVWRHLQPVLPTLPTFKVLKFAFDYQNPEAYAPLLMIKPNWCLLNPLVIHLAISLIKRLPNCP